MNNQFFSWDAKHTNSASLNGLVNSMKELEVDENVELCTQNIACSQFYIIESGKIPTKYF